MSQHAFVYFVLRSRAYCACVCVQLFARHGSIIPPTEKDQARKVQFICKQLKIFRAFQKALIFNSRNVSAITA